MPESLRLEQIFGGEHFVFSHHLHSVENGQRVVEGAERIDHTAKLAVGQPLSHIVGKTRPKHEDMVCVIDAKSAFTSLYFSIKVH